MGKMSTCADVLGIESKTGMDGSQVYKNFLDGNHQDIKDYNMQDVEVTLAIAKRIL